MKCPIDNTDLQMTERQGVEIDYCPQCRGIWLDRGELDKIIERAESETGRHFDSGGYNIPPSHGRHEERYSYGKHSKRKGLLGELFDF